MGTGKQKTLTGKVQSFWHGFTMKGELLDLKWNNALKLLSFMTLAFATGSYSNYDGQSEKENGPTNKLLNY